MHAACLVRNIEDYRGFRFFSRSEQITRFTTRALGDRSFLGSYCGRHDSSAVA
jgi:hypothetical protein